MVNLDTTNADNMDTPDVFQQAWEFQEGQYCKAWTPVVLTGRRRVTQGNPNYDDGRVVEYEIAAGLYETYAIENYEVLLKEYYLEDRWVSESKIKILGELTTVIYKSDGTMEEEKN
jgi:hypothetical protein